MKTELFNKEVLNIMEQSSDEDLNQMIKSGLTMIDGINMGLQIMAQQEARAPWYIIPILSWNNKRVVARSQLTVDTIGEGMKKVCEIQNSRKNNGKTVVH